MASEWVSILIPFGDRPSPCECAVHLQCPVMRHFGALDQNPTPAEVRRSAVAPKKHGKICDVKIYPWRQAWLYRR
jgi:hypothetical protein